MLAFYSFSSFLSFSDFFLSFFHLLRSLWSLVFILSITLLRLSTSSIFPFNRLFFSFLFFSFFFFFSFCLVLTKLSHHSFFFSFFLFSFFLCSSSIFSDYVVPINLLQWIIYFRHAHKWCHTNSNRPHHRLAPFLKRHSFSVSLSFFLSFRNEIILRKSARRGRRTWGIGIGQNKMGNIKKWEGRR